MNQQRRPESRTPVSWGAVIGFGMLGLLWPFLQFIGFSTAFGELAAVLTAFLVVSCVWLLGAGLGSVPRPVVTLTLSGLIAGMLLSAVTVVNGGLIAGGAFTTLLASALEAGRLAGLGALIGLAARAIQKARQPTSASG